MNEVKKACNELIEIGELEITDKTDKKVIENYRSLLEFVKGKADKKLKSLQWTLWELNNIKS
jgi:hypothetical protein